MRILFRKPYVYFVLLIFFLYILLDLVLSGFYSTIPLIILYSKTVDWLKIGTSLFLTFSIGILVALNSVLLYIKHKERKHCRSTMALSGVGATAGLITGVCPLCVTGVIPLLLGLLGVSFSFATLPFGGIEIQALVALVLLTTLITLSRKKNASSFG